MAAKWQPSGRPSPDNTADLNSRRDGRVVECGCLENRWRPFVSSSVDSALCTITHRWATTRSQMAARWQPSCSRVGHVGTSQARSTRQALGRLGRHSNVEGLVRGCRRSRDGAIWRSPNDTTLRPPNPDQLTRRRERSGLKPPAHAKTRYVACVGDGVGPPEERIWYSSDANVFMRSTETVAPDPGHPSTSTKYAW